MLQPFPTIRFDNEFPLYRLMLSPRGALMMFIIGYYILQWLGFIGK
jgi:hypothetical protein